MFDYDALATLIIGFICMIILSLVITAGVSIAEVVTYEVEAEYTDEAIVTKTDAHKNDHGIYSYKVYAVNENGDVYSDTISEEEYAIINTGDKVTFAITETSTCFGDNTKWTYVV